MRRRITNLLLIATILVVAPSCSVHQQTLAPKAIVSHQASFDGNVANSGILSADATGFLVSEHWLARYDAMLGKYGSRLSPVVAPGNREGVKAVDDGTFRVTAQVMVRFTRLNQWRKSDQS